MQPGTPSRGSRSALWLAVFALAFAAFSPALGHGFVAWDDDVNFVHNPHYRGLSAEHLRWMFTSFHTGHYMPLTWLSVAVDHALWGMDARGYHLSSLVLHALAAVLFGRLVERLLRAGGARADRTTALAAAAGALFFALHPLRVESVAWATERRDVLSGVLLLACVLAWLRARIPGERRTRWYVSSVLLYAAALLSKTSGMSLPLVLLILEAVPLERQLGALGGRWRAVLLDKLPFAVLSAGAAALALAGQARGTELLAGIDARPLGDQLLARLALGLYGVAFYVWKTLLPLGLAPLYELEPRLDPFAARYVAAGATVLALSVAAALAARRTRGAAPAAWLAYLVLILPLSGLVQIGWHRAADRYSYLATLPFAVLFAAALERSARHPERRVATTLAVGALLLGLGLATLRQTGFWRDSETLFRRMVAVDPAGPIARRKLGVELHEQGRYDEAIATFEQALELRPAGDTADTLASLALSAYTRDGYGDQPRVFAALEAALDQNPIHPLALKLYVDRGLALGRTVAVEQRLSAALEHDPTHVPAFLGQARMASRSGDHERALARCEAALSADRDSVEALNLAGVELLYLGRLAEAEARLRRAIELRPGDATAHVNLGVVREQAGDGAGARELWKRALELQPEHPAARRLLSQP